MLRTIKLDQVREVLRARVCRNCKLRNPGRPGDELQVNDPLACEAGCELFDNLPELTALANHLDAMLLPHDVALNRRMSRLIRSGGDRGAARDGRSSPLNRHRRCVIETLTELVDGQARRARTRRKPYGDTAPPEQAFRSDTDCCDSDEK